MKFTRLAPSEAVGAYLAYPVAALKKGTKLSRADVAHLIRADIKTIIAAQLDKSTDIDETKAAAQLAKAAAGNHIRLIAAHGGRVNLHARKSGLLVYDTAQLNKTNGIDEACTLAALPPYAKVKEGERLASVKIIPLGVKRKNLSKVVAAAKDSLCLHPFHPLRASLIHTSLPHTKTSLRAKAENITQARLEAIGGSLTATHHCPHEVEVLANSIASCAGSDLVLVHSAQAIIDRRDIVPQALRRAGGKLIHFGMPVEPGNLLLFGEWQRTPFIGLPGCARSPKRNGLDWVLERLAAGLPLGRKEITRMGAGGLLP